MRRVEVIKNRKRVALVGCGIWGKNILTALLDLGVEVNVFDLDDRLKSVVLELGASDFSPRLPRIAKFDGVVIASPSSTHRSVLEAVVAWGVPIFVEKPLVTTREDAQKLREALHQDVFLMHVWLYHNGIRMLAEIGRSGELGAVKGIRSTRANWTSPRRDTDSLWNLAPHDITITKAILGYIPEPRLAVAEIHDGVIRGFYGVLGRAPYSIFEVSNRYHQKLREVRLHCEEGVAILKDERVDYVEVVRGDCHSSAEELPVERRPFENTPPLVLELKSFLDYLDGGSAPLSSFADGLEVVEILHQLEKLAMDS